MDNLCDKWLKKYYGKINFENYILLDRAARTLESNSWGLSLRTPRPWFPLRGITPSESYFRGVWNWDCAFHAMGAANWDPELARDQIRIFMKIQQEDGMYPDCWFYEDDRVFNGSSKPPVLPWAALTIEEVDPNPEFLTSAYESFVRNEQFWMIKRGGMQHGMFFYDGNSNEPEERLQWGGWESGWDNSPRWDTGVNKLFSIDLNCYMVIYYRSMAKIADKLKRSEDICEWRQKEKNLIQRIETSLWDEEASCYFDYDYINNKFIRVITPASFMPLFIKTASPEQAEKMAEIGKNYLAPGWPSVSYKDKEYDPIGYWRGRTWLNIAFFALKGLKNYGFNDLAEEGRNTILSWVRRDAGTIYENYNSQTGMPAGIPHFSWSAVFVIKFILDW